MDKSTIVCRCEEITIADVENAVRQGARTFNDVKRLTRGGMGMCQGKTCQSVIVGLIAQFNQKPITNVVTSTRARIPLQPIEIKMLAAIQNK